MKGMKLAFQGLPKPGKGSAILSKITNAKATAVEKRRAQGYSAKVTGPSYTAQTRKKIKGARKLLRKKEIKA
jgi:hypothetical protein